MRRRVNGLFQWLVKQNCVRKENVSNAGLKRQNNFFWQKMAVRIFRNENAKHYAGEIKSNSICSMAAAYYCKHRNLICIKKEAAHGSAKISHKLDTPTCLCEIFIHILFELIIRLYVRETCCDFGI